MLFVIDVGNTHTVLGVYDGSRLVGHWRVRTERGITGDELGMQILALFRHSGIAPDLIRGIAVANVVPPLAMSIEQMAGRYFRIEPYMVGTGSATGLSFRYENPREIGADRIVDAAAAWGKHHRALIVIDFGTATTFDCVTSDGAYIGGVIIPGIEISLEALTSRASKLPRIELRKPGRIIATDTVSAIQSGIIYGYAGMVDAICRQIKIEMGDPDPVVLATGGLACVIAPETTSVDEVDEMLTLEGLRMLYAMNARTA